MRLADAVVGRISPAKINVLAGRAVAGLPRDAQLDCLRDNLAFVDDFAPAGIKTVTELLNPVETPEFLLSDVGTLETLLDSLDGRVGFQLDVYQLQRAGGELIPTIRALAKHIWHVQIADAPDRSEPGTGEINIPNVLQAVRAAGYLGLVGLEYFPYRRDDPFGWMTEAHCVPA